MMRNAGIRRSSPYGPSTAVAASSKPTRKPSDPRYRKTRWRKRRLEVLNRDRWQCKVVRDCPRPATIADHIIPVFPGMPDSLFYSPSNLRASCARHNTARGWQTYAERELGTAKPTSVVMHDYTRRKP